MTDDAALRPISRTRKRANLTGTSFDFARMEIYCPNCGKDSLEPIIELVMNDTVECRYCGNVIDISSDGARTEIAKFAEIQRQIKPI